MPAPTYSGSSGWRAPTASGPLAAVVELPGSKSLTNRELVLSALADGPSVAPPPAAGARHRSHGRRAPAAGRHDRDDRRGRPPRHRPDPSTGGADIDCGLAGTLMRFLPPVALLADGPVRFDGDERARARPMATTVLSLRALGATVDDDGRGTLPFTVTGGDARARRPGDHRRVGVEPVRLRPAARRRAAARGHRGGAPRQPAAVDAAHRDDDRCAAAAGRACRGGRPRAPGRVLARRSAPHPRARGDDRARPLERRPVPRRGARGRRAPCTVPGWPEETTQVGDRLRDLLAAFGAEVRLEHGALVVDGGGGALARPLTPVDLDLSEAGELTPTLVGLAAFADGRSTVTGIGHLRGHETDRLAALAAELTAVGTTTTETEDGLVVDPGPLRVTRPTLARLRRPPDRDDRRPARARDRRPRWSTTSARRARRCPTSRTAGGGCSDELADGRR